jgi:alpha-N-arabinofuranosidase
MSFASAAAALLLGLMSAACGQALPASASAEPRRATEPFLAEIRLGRPAGPVNRRILGSNVQWVDRGDALLAEDGSRFDPRMLELVKKLGPTVLRYPGGALADTFDWRAGNGPIHSRGTSEHFHTRQRQRVLFGTAEPLALPNCWNSADTWVPNRSLR